LSTQQRLVYSLPIVRAIFSQSLYKIKLQDVLQ